jgi:ankyrin repeat protein
MATFLTLSQYYLLIDQIFIISYSDISFLGNTPLHWSALNGHTDMCELLIKHGANPTIRNNNGFSPATLAEQREFMECANIILKAYDPDEDEDGAKEVKQDGVEEYSVLSSNDPEYQEFASR